MKKNICILIIMLFVFIISVIGAEAKEVPDFEIVAINNNTDLTKHTITDGSDNILFGSVLYASVPEGCEWMSSDSNVLKLIGTFREKNTNKIWAQFLTASTGSVSLILTDNDNILNSIEYKINSNNKTIKLQFGKSYVYYDFSWGVVSDNSMIKNEGASGGLLGYSKITCIKSGVFCMTIPCYDGDEMHGADTFEVPEATIFQKLIFMIREVFENLIKKLGLEMFIHL